MKFPALYCSFKFQVSS